MEVKLENTKAQMRKGILELCVLSIIAEGEAYPADIISKLKASELIIVEGTLYPLLNRLKDAGLLEYTWQESLQGPPRKYYKITPLGSIFLDSLFETWNKLNQSINQLYNLKIKSKNEESI